VSLSAATALLWRGKAKAAWWTLVAVAVYSFVHCKIWQWSIPNVVLGSNADLSGPYLQSTGLPQDASAKQIRANFNAVALRGTAIIMTIVAIVIAALLTSLFSGVKLMRMQERST
jgi:hypothetical protein